MSLNVENIAVSYQDKHIIKDLSLEVMSGEVLGIAGINGAGKSTTLKTIAGILPFSHGSIGFNDNVMDSPINREIAKGFIGYCPDVGGVIPAATPREHINLLLNLNRVNNKENVKRAEELLKLMHLDEHADAICGSFSHGMLRRMSVILASLNAKDLLILDEPFDGVDPQGIKAIQEIVLWHKNRGDIVLISSHLIHVLAETADRIIVMKDGKIIDSAEAKKFSGDKGFRFYAKMLEQ
jgi:ABC-2 type transport system ATP-binding protein